ncbi:MAG: NADH:ubiquinone reductase (Na(+)-transporting) subunit F [Bacteroidales bacterium]
MQLTTLIIAISVFLILTLILVILLLYIKSKVTPSGTVKIDINNGEKELEVTPGNSLLSTLSSEKIFLPSACGGKGTCGMCKCQVISGGGSILSTETGFFTRKQKNDNWRLGCQVKVKEDIGMLIPQSILGIKKMECEVISNRNVATFIKEFIVKLPEGEDLNFRAGGYVQIDIPKCEIDFHDITVDEEYKADWEKYGFFNLKMINKELTFRAYSMANHPAEGNIVMLNIRIATPPFDKVNGGLQKVNPGISSSYIYSRKPGDKVTLSGPYGEFFMKDTDNEIIFVGGGAGMAPMRSHIFDLFKTKKTTRKVTFFYGSRSLKEAFYLEDFHEIEKEFPNFKFVLALDRKDPEADKAGVEYQVGFVHQVAYNTYLKNHETPEDIEYYLCGPPMMTESVQKMCDDLGVPEENVMFDNFGA